MRKFVATLLVAPLLASSAPAMAAVAGPHGRHAPRSASGRGVFRARGRRGVHDGRAASSETETFEALVAQATEKFKDKDYAGAVALFERAYQLQKRAGDPVQHRPDLRGGAERRGGDRVLREVHRRRERRAQGPREGRPAPAGAADDRRDPREGEARRPTRSRREEAGPGRPASAGSARSRRTRQAAGQQGGPAEPPAAPGRLRDVRHRRAAGDRRGDRRRAGARAGEGRADAETLADREEANQLGRSRAITADALFITGGLVAAIGVVLLVVPAIKKARTDKARATRSLTPHVSPTQVGLGFTHRF
jgi:hypothetical protein